MGEGGGGVNTVRKVIAIVVKIKSSWSCDLVSVILDVKRSKSYPHVNLRYRKS